MARQLLLVVPVVLVFAGNVSRAGSPHSASSSSGQFQNILWRLDELETENRHLRAEMQRLDDGYQQMQHSPVRGVSYSTGETADVVSHGCDGGCACGGGCGCCACGCCPRWYAGYDNVLVKPYFSRNLAFWNDSDGEASPFQEEATSFDWDLEYSPRIVIGYGCQPGIGVQVRYWRFDNDTRLAVTEAPGQNLEIEVDLFVIGGRDMHPDTGETLTGRHSIELDVIDLEVTQHWNTCYGWFRANGGIRYVEMEQQGFWTTVEDGFDHSLLLRHRFEGIGPTAFLETGLPLTSCLCGFVNGRGSLLFGDRFAMSRETSTDPNFLNDTAALGETMLTYDGLLHVLEAQVGVVWTCNYDCYTVSLRTALEAQYWHRAGSATGGDDEGVPADTTDMGFLGLSAAVLVDF